MWAEIYLYGESSMADAFYLHISPSFGRRIYSALWNIHGLQHVSDSWAGKRYCGSGSNSRIVTAGEHQNRNGPNQSVYVLWIVFPY